MCGSHRQAQRHKGEREREKAGGQAASADELSSNCNEARLLALETDAKILCSLHLCHVLCAREGEIENERDRRIENL